MYTYIVFINHEYSYYTTASTYAVTQQHVIQINISKEHSTLLIAIHMNTIINLPLYATLANAPRNYSSYDISGGSLAYFGDQFHVDIG